MYSQKLTKYVTCASNIICVANVGKNNFTRPNSINGRPKLLHSPERPSPDTIAVLRYMHLISYLHAHTRTPPPNTGRRMNFYCLRVLTGVVCSHRSGPKSVGAGRGTPETEPDVYRPGERGAAARTVVRAQHASVAQPDRQVHGRAEPDAVPAKVPAARVEERSVLVQKSPGQVQATKDVPVRRHVA